MFATPAFKPFESRGRRAVLAILATFALCSGVSVGLSIWATSRSKNQATVVELAARQRTLAERYLSDVLLAREGRTVDPEYTAGLLVATAKVLLEGGAAPAVNGDDDETTIVAASGGRLRGQLTQQRRLVNDLTATGRALLDGRP